jgi:outer membrane protein OmpA-like peptidoglycan-associated protein
VWPNLYFAQGKAELLPAARASLDTLATILHQQPGLRLQVQGHTDNQGDSILNRQLSQRRAEVVCRYLVASGIADGRLQAKGYGGSKPIADNQVVALRARNRRVVLQPLP